MLSVKGLLQTAAAACFGKAASNTLYRYYHEEHIMTCGIVLSSLLSPQSQSNGITLTFKYGSEEAPFHTFSQLDQENGLKAACRYLGEYKTMHEYVPAFLASSDLKVGSLLIAGVGLYALSFFVEKIKNLKDVKNLFKCKKKKSDSQIVKELQAEQQAKMQAAIRAATPPIVPTSASSRSSVTSKPTLQAQAAKAEEVAKQITAAETAKVEAAAEFAKQKAAAEKKLAEQAQAKLIEEEQAQAKQIKEQQEAVARRAIADAIKQQKKAARLAQSRGSRSTRRNLLANPPASTVQRAAKVTPVQNQRDLLETQERQLHQARIQRQLRLLQEAAIESESAPKEPVVQASLTPVTLLSVAIPPLLHQNSGMSEDDLEADKDIWGPLVRNIPSSSPSSPTTLMVKL